MKYHSNQPFRFLDLPKELRILIYEFLPNRVVRTDYVRTQSHDDTTNSFTLISTFATKAILATCKQVKEEAEGTVYPITRRIPRSPTCAQLPGLGVRIETHCQSLCFLGTQNGIIDAVTRWFHRLRQDRLDESIPRFEEEEYLAVDVFNDNGYSMKGGTAEQGLLRARDFVYKAGWALYHLSQNCSLQEFQDSGCNPSSKSIFELRGPLVQIALTHKENDTPSDYYGLVTEFYESIEELESSFGIGFLVHLLSAGCVSEAKTKEWIAVKFSISDLLHGGEMMEGTHGFLKEGVFELDRAESVPYRKYWCECEWPENCVQPSSQRRPRLEMQ